MDGGTVKPFTGSHPKCVKVASQKGWPLMRGGQCAISRTHVFLCVLVDHWGSSHEGSGRHPRQHGGGRGRRFAKFMTNSHRVCSLLRPSFCELIVNVMGHIDAES